MSERTPSSSRSGSRVTTAARCGDRGGVAFGGPGQPPARRTVAQSSASTQSKVLVTAFFHLR